MKHKRKINRKLYDDIDRYITKKMTAEEEDSFVKKINNDARLFRKVKLTLLMIKAMRKIGKEQDCNILEEIKALPKKEQS